MKIKYSNLLLGLLLPIASLSAADMSLIPPDAKPGECYAKVLTPEKYENVEEKVVVREATEKITIIPAEYETVEQKIEIVPEMKKLVPVPAKYTKMVETVEVKPAERIWKTSLKKKALPVSKVLLDTLKAQSVDIDGATAGTCFKEYFQSAKYKIIEEDVIVQKEHNETEVIPAEFETVEENVEVVPSSKKVVEIPAEYDTIEEKVLVEEAKTVWKKGQNPAQQLSGATGEIMCLVKVPAKYKTIKKHVVKSPARTEIQEVPAKVKTLAVQKLITPARVQTTLVPAVHKMVEKKVLDKAASFMWEHADSPVDEPWRATGNRVCLVEVPAKTKEIKKVVLEAPASVEEEVVPAKYEIAKVQKMITPEKEVKTPIDAEYKMIEKRKKIADSHLAWQRILCQTNMTKNVIAKIQTALNDLSYKAGKADGALGRGTRAALERFQKDNGLATGGITYETLTALNIEL